MEKNKIPSFTLYADDLNALQTIQFYYFLIQKKENDKIKKRIIDLMEDFKEYSNLKTNN